MTNSNWDALDRHENQTLVSLFENDAQRVEKLTIELAGIRFDLSKTHLDDGLLTGFSEMAIAAGLSAQKEALFTGAIVNPTEGRAAEHTAGTGVGKCRGGGPCQRIAEPDAELNRCNRGGRLG